MVQRSAGILFYRLDADSLRVLLVHPGGPFWKNRDAGAWQLPKGAIDPGEDDEAAARREAAEELGVTVSQPLAPLGEIRQAGGKYVAAFAVRQDVDVTAVRSITFDLEWPRGSGAIRTFPEVDEARWFTIAETHDAMLASQRPFVERLALLLKVPPGDGERRP